MISELIGVFEKKYYKVVVHGCVVPNLEAMALGDDKFELVLDGRFAVQGKWEEMQDYVWLIANAQAIGAGYTYHGPNSKLCNPFACQITGVIINAPDKSADIVDFPVNPNQTPTE